MHKFIKITTLYITLIFLTANTFIKAQSFPNSKEVQFQAGLKRLDSMNSALDSMNNVLKETQNSIISQRIAQATETISNQSAIISSFGNIYTVISIFIAIIAIGLPILMYLFGIRPSRQALKEFNENADKKFATFLLNHKKSQIDTAIKNLKEESEEIKNTAIRFLSSNYDTKFNETQINKLLEILQDETIANAIKDQLYHCIGQVKNNAVKKYYLDYLNTSTEVNDHKSSSAIRFMSFYDTTVYLPSFTRFINNYPDPNLIYSLLQVSLESREEMFLAFINDKGFVDSLNDERLMISKLFLDLDSFWKIPIEEAKNSYMYSKIQSILNGSKLSSIK